MRYAILVVAALAGFAAVWALAREDRGPDGDRRIGHIVMTGSSTVAPLAAELAKRFEASHSDVRVDVQTGGSARGVSDVRERQSSIGMVSRALKPEESDLHAFTIALDGIAIIVHKDNPVPSLTDAQVRAIYLGEVDNWDQVGGPASPITVVSKAEGRSTLELFLAHYGLKASDIRADVIIGDNEQGIKTVSGNPTAIGYVSVGSAEYDAEAGVPIRLLPMGGVDANMAAVAKGAYPLSRQLNLVTREPPEGLVEEFIDFARSPENDDLVQRLYFVPIPR